MGAAGGLIQYVVQGRDSYGNALTADSSSTFSLTIFASCCRRACPSITSCICGVHSRGAIRRDFLPDSFSLVLDIYPHRRCLDQRLPILARGGTGEYFSKVFYKVKLPSKYSAALTFEKFCQATRSAAHCLVSGNVIPAHGGAGVIPAGASALVTVVGVDSYGNWYTAGDKWFEALLSGPLECTGVPGGVAGGVAGSTGGSGGCSFTFSRNVDNVGTGSTSASFVVTLSGKYTLKPGQAPFESSCKKASSSSGKRSCNKGCHVGTRR